MFCCFCKRGASEESPLCAELYCQPCQKGEGCFLYLTSFSHMLHWLGDALEK